MSSNEVFQYIRDALDRIEVRQDALAEAMVKHDSAQIEATKRLEEVESDLKPIKKRIQLENAIVKLAGGALGLAVTLHQLGVFKLFR